MRSTLQFVVLVLAVLHISVLSNSVHAQIYTDDIALRVRLYPLAYMDIEPQGTLISMQLTQPTEAGMPSQGSTNSSKWINYSSCLKSTASDRYITIEIGSGSIPSGVQLTVTASAYSGTGGGATGTPNGTVILSSTAQTLVSGIRGAYTSNGINNGHQLNYELSVSDYGQLNFDQTTTIQLIYTIVD